MINVQTARLNEQFKKCFQLIDTLPGSDLTSQEQDELYRQYEQKLQQKWCASR